MERPEASSAIEPPVLTAARAQGPQVSKAPDRLQSPSPQPSPRNRGEGEGCEQREGEGC
jgi:hypothetical protein